MPLEIAVRGFAIKKGIKLEETETGFSSGTDGRLQIKHIREQDYHVYLCGRLFAMRCCMKVQSVFQNWEVLGIGSSGVFRSLKRLPSPASCFQKKILINLRERLETHLGDNKNPEDFVRECFTEFNSSNLYQSLTGFIPETAFDQNKELFRFLHFKDVQKRKDLFSDFPFAFINCFSGSSQFRPRTDRFYSFHFRKNGDIRSASTIPENYRGQSRSKRHRLPIPRISPPGEYLFLFLPAEQVIGAYCSEEPSPG